jgi:hypothetical protein
MAEIVRHKMTAIIDCKLRGCDLVCLKVNDVYAAARVKERASVTQSKTRKPVRFEITETTRLSVERWIKDPELNGCEYLWPSRVHASPHLSTRQYERIMRDWVLSIGLEPNWSGSPSLIEVSSRFNISTITSGHRRAVSRG